MILRPYQNRLVKKAKANLKKNRNTLAISATGSGKTIMLAALAKEMGGKTLILQHRQELLEQNLQKFRKVNPDWRLSVFDAQTKSMAGDAVFASQQTLVRNLDCLPQFDHVIVDEVHHIVAPTYAKIIEACKANNKKLLLSGFTATPQRGDKKSLRRFFNNVADQITIKELVSLGFLVPPRAFVVDIGVQSQLSRLASQSAFGDQSAVADVLDTRPINDEVVRHWKERAGDRKTIVFCSTVQHALDVADAFRSAGFNAATVHGDMPTRERQDTIRDFDRGSIQILTNVAVLTEGFDSQPVGCVILLRLCSEKGPLIQMVGRGLRTVDPEIYPGVVKKDCIAEGALILTDCGLVEISQVSTSMRLWDGVEWVSHQGVICKGEQEVIEYEGLLATPDHKVWTSSGWVRFDECARRGIPIAVTGRDGEAIREVEGYFTGDTAIRKEKEENFASLMRGLWRHFIQGLQQRDALQGRMSEMWESETGTIVVGKPLHFSEREMHQQKNKEIQGLRWAWDRIQIFLSNRNGNLDCRKPWAGSQQTNRQDKQQWSLRTWQHQINNSFSESVKHAWHKIQRSYASVQDRLSRYKIRGQHNTTTLLDGTERTSDSRSFSQHEIQKTKRRVWDILNAGPRHRFTVNGLLVSNCIVLDFGTSILTHGNLDQEDGLHEEKADKGKGEAITKTCPDTYEPGTHYRFPDKKGDIGCGIEVPAQTRICPVCGFIFERLDGQEPLTEVDLTEINILEASPFRWHSLFDSDLALVATGFESWAGIFSPDHGDTWVALGGKKNDRIHKLAITSRTLAMAAADDWMRATADVSAVRKSKRWLDEPATEKQLAILNRFGYNVQADFMGNSQYSKYSAACHAAFNFNRNAIEKALGVV